LKKATHKHKKSLFFTRPLTSETEHFRHWISKPELNFRLIVTDKMMLHKEKGEET